MKRSLATAIVALASMLPGYSALAAQNSCDGPIVIGTTIAETGPFATLTGGWRKMTDVFVDEVNKDGGVMVRDCGKKLPLKFVVYDDQSNPATATSLHERMATVDNVDFFAGVDWSSVAIPVTTVAEKHKIPLVAANLATPSAFERGLQYLWATPYPAANRWAERYFEMVATVQPKPSTIYFVVHDNPIMKSIHSLWAPKAEAQGLKIVGTDMFPGDLKDFSSIVLKIRSARPDIIFITSFDNASVPLVQQLRQYKIKAMDVHHTILSRALDRQTKAYGGIEGMTGELAWYPGVKGDYSDFAERVFKNAGLDPFENLPTFVRFASYLVMVQAIEKAGAVDREKVRAALYKGTFKAPPGDIVFPENGFPQNAVLTTQIQKGEVVIVWPPQRATGKVIWPSPSWQ